MIDLFKRFINATRMLLPGGGWTHGETACHCCGYIQYSLYHRASLWLECPQCGGLHRFDPLARFDSLAPDEDEDMKKES